MLRILHIIGAMDSGGAEVLIMNIYRKIDKTKFQFDFLVNSKEKCHYDDEIRLLGGRIYYIDKFKLYNKYSYEKQLKKFLVEHPEYLIIHGHIGSSAESYTKIGKKMGRNVILHSHSEWKSKNLKGIIFNYLNNRAGKKADALLGCSHNAGVNRFGINNLKDKFIVLKNGVDASKFVYNSQEREKLKEKLSLQNMIVIGHVGRFSEEKNHSFIIDVFERLSKMNENLKLVLVGDGPLKNTIENYVLKKNLNDKVIFIGFVDDVNNYYSLFDVLLFPSVFEGLPLTIVEAQVSGLPIVMSSNITDEVVLTNLVKKVSLSNDYNEWMQIVNESIFENININRLDNYKKIVVEAGFDSEKTIEKLVNLYESLSNNYKNL